MSWQPAPKSPPRDGKPRWIWTKRRGFSGQPEMSLAFYTNSVWQMATIQDGQPRFEIVDAHLVWAGETPREPTTEEIEAA